MLAALLLKLSPVGGILKSIPRWAWIALAAIALLVGGYLWHQHKLHQHDAALVKATIAAEDARIAKQALALKARIDALTGHIAAEERTRNDEENRRIAADADGLRVQGPGRAACSRLPAAASGHVSPGGAGRTPVDQVPDAGGQFIALPFPDTIDFAEQHDTFREEVISWREWYRKLVAAWPKAAAVESKP